MKEKITQAVERYKEEHKDEFRKFSAQLTETRRKLRNERLGGTYSFSALYEVPETLDNMITAELTPEEQSQFALLENARWFAVRFPEFRIPDEV